jgi:hypothetical protein
MSLQALYELLALLGLLAEVSLFVILIVRRQYSTFPVFTSYIGVNVLSDVGVATLAFAYPGHIAQSVELGFLPLQYLMEIGVLVEIAWNVLRPVKASLPQRTVRVFLSLVAISLLIGVVLAGHVRATGNKIKEIEYALTLTTGLCRMLVFAATAGFAQLLGIGWKNTVLRLATALSFYSAADLIISLIERHGYVAALEPIRGCAYLLMVGFLVWAFTTKEVRRREFSPQMEQFLVTLAGRARVARTALARTQVK